MMAKVSVTLLKLWAFPEMSLKSIVKEMQFLGREKLPNVVRLFYIECKCYYKNVHLVEYKNVQN